MDGAQGGILAQPWARPRLASGVLFVDNTLSITSNRAVIRACFPDFNSAWINLLFYGNTLFFCPRHLIPHA